MLKPNLTNNSKHPPQILIVDDEESQQLMMRRVMEKEGYRVLEASNGAECLEICHSDPPDIVLLDALMPVMDGFDCCAMLQALPTTYNVPVLMITALDDKQSVNRAFEVGATDYITKPIHWAVLIQRVRRLIQQSQLHKQLIESQAQNERLLLDIFPEAIVKRLRKEERVIADRFENVSVLFADMVGFTQFSTQVSATEVVAALNLIFSQFDDLTEYYGVEKIKTIGDGYMVATGLHVERNDCADAILEMALAMQKVMLRFDRKERQLLGLRIGIHSGPVVAGVIGTKKFSYDLWGDTVNTASRMEQHGIPGCIQISEATYRQLSKSYLFAERGNIEVKGKGKMKTYIFNCLENNLETSDLIIKKQTIGGLQMSQPIRVREAIAEFQI
jgi:adenylate cyclase